MPLSCPYCSSNVFYTIYTPLPQAKIIYMTSACRSSIEEQNQVCI